MIGEWKIPSVCTHVLKKVYAKDGTKDPRSASILTWTSRKQHSFFSTKC